MGKRKVENAVECAFPATWERAAPYKPWRTAPSTPGPMSVADGEVLRAVLPNSATDADVSAALSLIERLRIRQVSLTRGAAITRDGLKGLAALSGGGQVKVELEGEPDEAGLQDCEIEFWLPDNSRRVSLELSGIPADLVSTAVAQLRGVKELKLTARSLNKPFDLAPLFGLEDLRSLEFLGGFNTEFDWTGLSRLSQLEELRIEEGAYNARFWEELARLPALKRLALDNVVRWDIPAGVLQNMTSLEELSVGFALHAADEGWRQLGQCPAVRKLSIDGTPVSDAMAEGLSQLRKVETAYFWQLKLSDEALKALCRMTALRSLVLGLDVNLDVNEKQPITDAGFRALGDLQNLESLQLRQFENLTPEGWQVLRTLPRLKQLKLFPPQTLDILSVLGPLATVEDLEITHGNAITSAGWSVLAEMPALRRIYLYPWVARPYQSPFAGLAQATGLTAVSLVDLRETKDADLKSLSALKELEELELRPAKRITDAGLEALSRMPRLRRVVLTEIPKLTDAGLGHLVRIPRLQQLSIQCTTKVTDDGYALLERARKLESLELSYARNLTEQRLFSIAAALPSLRELTIGQCPDLTDEGILELVRTAKLRSLKIPYCKQITEAGYAAVRELLPDME